MLSSEANEPSVVVWNNELSQLIVHRKVMRLITGEIQQAGSKERRTRPPAIESRLFNLDSTTRPMTSTRARTLFIWLAGSCKTGASVMSRLGTLVGFNAAYKTS